MFLPLLLFLPTVLSLTCTSGSAPVFFVDRLSDRNNHCFIQCGDSDCSGVLLHKEGCIALNMQHYFGHIDEKAFVKKRCIEGVSSTTVASYHNNDGIILDHTQSIKKAKDKFQCLSLCTQEKNFTCLSVMFYAESGECLLNSANSDSVTLKSDTEGFKVELMERRLLLDTSNCVSAFSLVPLKEKEIRGDIQLHNATSSQECMAFCIDCDLLIYSEVFQECFVVKSDNQGKVLKLSEEEYMILENLCLPPSAGCDLSHPMFISYKGFSKEQKTNCLQSCFSSSNCNFAYLIDGKCKITEKPIKDEKKILERKCIPGNGIEEGIFFEESELCSPPSDGMVVKEISLDECLELCLKHPTQSCTAVAFSYNSKECILMEEMKGNQSRKDCRQFSLNVITKKTIEQEGEAKNLSSFMEPSAISGKVKKQGVAATKSAKSNGVKTKKKKIHGTKKMDVHKSAEMKKLSEVKLETICNYHEIVVRISSVFPVSGEVFVRNQHDLCGIRMEKETHSQLIIDISKNKCGVEKDGSTYSTVIVVKENGLTTEPIITETDKMFRISCDYGNGTAATAATRSISMKHDDYKELKIPGLIKAKNIVEMELRSKRQQEIPRQVELGQAVELIFKNSKMMNSGYSVRDCEAFSADGEEKLQLIEDGCPTTASRSYIFRAAPKLTPEGFILPFRVFKFKSSDRVEIKCSLKMCEKCEQVSCSDNFQRKRRTLPSLENSGHTEEIVTTMIVRDALELTAKDKGYCMQKLGLIAIGAAIAILIIMEAAAVIYIKRRKHVVFLSK